MWKIDDTPGLFAAVDLQGRFIYVHPASRTVIVKLSYFPPDPAMEANKMTADYFKAVTGWSPNRN